MTRPYVLVSNRGPVRFDLTDRSDGPELTAKRGAGGLVSGLAPLVSRTGATWVAATMSEGDRIVASGGGAEAEGMKVRLVDIDPATYKMAYDVIGNSTLWFLHHGLWDLSRRPRFDRRWREAWSAYRDKNSAFADVLLEMSPHRAIVLVQDYHLCLLASLLRQRRPDLSLVHFHHTPFASSDLIRVLPDDAAHEMLTGLASHDACGFHTSRWAHNFRSCCDELGITSPHTFVSPLASDPQDLSSAATSPACATELAWIDEHIGDRRLVARVDRIELSKNLIRGFIAFEGLLERWPRWRNKVVFGAFVYPSREGLPEYLAYRHEVESVVASINDRWATDDWQPILLDTTDNFPRSIAALRRYDVLLVNPIRDGLNLVAKEGPLVNERDGVVLLSTEAGAFSELGDVAIGLNPFDVSATSEAIAGALELPHVKRREMAQALRVRAAQRTPADWLADQLAAAEQPR